MYGYYYKIKAPTPAWSNLSSFVMDMYGAILLPFYFVNIFVHYNKQYQWYQNFFPRFVYRREIKLVK